MVATMAGSYLFLRGNESLMGWEASKCLLVSLGRLAGSDVTKIPITDGERGPRLTILTQ